jgi:flagellar basal-body rod modification protein FlgD
MTVVTNTSSVAAAGLNLSGPGSTSASAALAAGKKDSSASLDKNAFLKLLAAQASNQDPMNPTDSTSQIAQLAQFSSLEQMNNVATTMTNMATAVNKQGALGLVGHDVTYKGEDGLDATGTVASVTMTSDGPLLKIGTVTGINPAAVTEVR